MSAAGNVLYVLHEPAGGAAEGILQLLHGLRDTRYKAFLAIAGKPEPYRSEQFRSVAEQVAVVPMGWWNLKYRYPLWYRPVQAARVNMRTRAHVGSVRALARLIRRWDIDLVYTCTAAILDGALAARLTGRPHLWHVKETVGRHGLLRFPLPISSLAQLMSDRLSDRLVCMSQFIARPFLDYGDSAHVRIVYDGVDVTRYGSSSGVADYRSRLGIAHDQILVAMAASLRSTWKRHELFLAVAAELAPRLPDVRFAIFGSPPVRYWNPAHNDAWHRYCRMRERVQVSGLEDRIRIGVFSSNIPQMMEATDILVHPCEAEPFGRIAIEAMAAGRPVVGPAAGGIAESVVDGETGLLVRPRDLSAFANAVETLARDPVLRKAMGRAGRERAERVFSLSSHVARVAGLYDELLLS